MKKLVIFVALLGLVACKKEETLKKGNGSISFYTDDLISRYVYFDSTLYSVPFTANISCGSQQLLTFDLPSGTYKMTLIRGTFEDEVSLFVGTGDCKIINHLKP